jgi:hypothetical protein
MKKYRFWIPVFTLILFFSMVNGMAYAKDVNELFSQLNKGEHPTSSDNIITNNPSSNCKSEESMSNSCNINQCTSIGSDSCNNSGGGGSNPVDTATILVEKEYRKGQDPDSNFEVTVDANNPHPAKFHPNSERPITVIVSPGSYQVSEDPITEVGRSYSQTYSEGCKGIIEPGDTKVCVITNTEDPAELTVVKRILSGSDPSPPSIEDFNYTLTHNDRHDGPYQFRDPPRDHGFAAGPFNVEETGVVDGYAPSYSEDCSGYIRNQDSLTCVVTNTYIE